MVRTVANCAGGPADQADDGPSTSGKEYLTYFAHRLLEFRRPELESIAQLVGCKDEQLRWRAPAGDVEHSPFWYLTLPSEEAAQEISKRMLMTKMLVEVWGEGADWGELQAAIEACPEQVKAPWLSPSLSFKVVVESFGRSVAMEEQLEAIHRLEFIPFQGSVRLRDPEVQFVLLMCDAGDHGSLIDAQVPPRLYFGRIVGVGDRGLPDRYSLRRRRYLGPTSMDAEMAFLMCNQAKVRPGQLVLDPYAGTGSILVAAAHYGAQVLGTDIDIKVIREGKVGPGGESLTIRSNFAQYGLGGRLADLIRLDTHHLPLRRDLEGILHAVIGDPPYGVRAGGKKSGAAPEAAAKRNPITDRATHIPATQPYTLGECLRDLLDMSARLLVVGGRLVYFLPASPETYDEGELPYHPALQLVANSEQILTSRYSRRLITMEKVRPYDADAAAAYHASKPDPTMAIDRIHDIVYEQIQQQQAGEENGGGKPRRRCRGKCF
ncbi:hypothetical protein Agub_g7525 [Astrephomene gubernaculifera]|uniref:Uncharacterized protein n=1 Tax=Astrephomene gubernaculifera TaxID=47775 RepID=A0AAD3HMS6_9CHLO|nr:hypothetical protein Agub_g7525 [Astrephomene gubernaculifera]